MVAYITLGRYLGSGFCHTLYLRDPNGTNVINIGKQWPLLMSYLRIVVIAGRQREGYSRSRTHRSELCLLFHITEIICRKLHLRVKVDHRQATLALGGFSSRSVQQPIVESMQECGAVRLKQRIGLAGQGGESLGASGETHLPTCH
jgi:hypothetical protein